MKRQHENRSQHIVSAWLCVAAVCIMAGACADRYGGYPDDCCGCEPGEGSEDALEGGEDPNNAEGVSLQDGLTPEQGGYALKSLVASAAGTTSANGYQLRSVVGAPVIFFQTSNEEYTLRSLVPWTGGQ